MQVELGPVQSADVRSWIRLSRRIIAELRVDAGDLAGVVDDDVLCQWSRLIDQWALAAGSEWFRWSQPLDAEVGEYLLHGLEQVFLSGTVQARITPEESMRQRPFTMHVFHSFVDALDAEGMGHVHYADQIRAKLRLAVD